MATLEVGKTYHTREKNTVEIVQREEKPDGDGVPTLTFYGKFTDVRNGSENLLVPPNNVAKFTEDGKWKARPGHDQPHPSCHDLVEECLA